MSYTVPMNKITLLTLLLAAVVANAERYPEGYADDRAAIVDLQGRYVMAMDYFDADGYAAVFAEDGVLDWARGQVIGRDTIYEFMATGTYDFTRGTPAAETPEGKNWPSTVRHLITNQVMKVDGESLFSLHKIHNEGLSGTFTAGEENPVKQLHGQ